MEIHHGGCQCGEVRFATMGQPERTGVCHCRHCQLRTGSAFGVSVYFSQKNLDVINGAPKIYRFETETGRMFSTHFCASCGTNVFWTLEALEGLVGVAGGCFDPPTFWYDITRETFTRSKAPFVCLGVAQSLETSPGYRPKSGD